MDHTIKSHLHVMVIPSNCEREAAGYLSNLRTRRWGTQSTTCEHGFLLLVETDGAEFLPITDQLVLNNDLVDSKFALLMVRLRLVPHRVYSRHVVTR